MNTRVLELLQRHVIACRHVLVNHNLLEALPSQVFIFNKILRNSSRRLRRGKHLGFGWSIHRRRISRLKINVMNLDRGLLGRKDRKVGLTTSGLDDLCLTLFSLRQLGKLSKSIVFDKFIFCHLQMDEARIGPPA